MAIFAKVFLGIVFAFIVSSFSFVDLLLWALLIGFIYYVYKKV